jgi:hypothetical protein
MVMRINIIARIATVYKDVQSAIVVDTCTSSSAADTKPNGEIITSLVEAGQAKRTRQLISARRSMRAHD